MKIKKPITALVAAGGVAIAVSACGSSVPSNSVASVDGNPITTRALDHWMFVLEKGQAAQTGSTQVIVPTDPPQFNACIKQAHEQIPATKKQPAKTLRGECQNLFTGLSGDVLDFLITDYWYQAETHKLGIAPTAAKLDKQFDKAKKQEFKTAAEYKTFLTETGQTTADVKYRLLASTDYNKLVKRDMKKVTSADISSYYKAHKSQFTKPATRDLRVIRTKAKATASQALSALKSGQSWKAVAAKYSDDATTKQTGGLLQGVVKGQEEQALDQVAFSSPVNKLEGPTHGTFGWYVVEVVKITPGSVESLAQAKATIGGQLKQAAGKKAATQVGKDLKKAYGANTICRTPYTAPDCKGYKKPAPAPTPTTAAPTTAPAGASTTPAGASTAPAGASTTPAGASTTPAGASTTKAPAGGAKTTAASGSSTTSK